MKNTNYTYEIRKSAGARADAYKAIFNGFGHTSPATLEYVLYSGADVETRKELCKVVFMSDKEYSHLLFPMIPAEVDQKDASLYSVFAVKNVMDHCAKHNVPASTYISTSESSTTASTFGFTHKDQESELAGKTFYEFSRPQVQRANSDQNATKAPERAQ